MTASEDMWRPVPGATKGQTPASGAVLAALARVPAYDSALGGSADHIGPNVVALNDEICVTGRGPLTSHGSHPAPFTTSRRSCRQERPPCQSTR